MADLIALKNASFETGDLTEWSVSATGTGNVTVVHSWTQGDGGSGPLSWGPTQGSWFALMSAGDAGTSVKLSQTFTANVGDVLQFAYFWDGGDAIEGGSYNDAAQATAQLTPGAGAPAGYSLFTESIATRGNYNGTPWQYVSFTIQATGTYDLVFELTNATDSRSDSYLGIDVVPLPGAVLLGFLGLAAAGLKLRQLA